MEFQYCNQKMLFGFGSREAKFVLQLPDFIVSTPLRFLFFCWLLTVVPLGAQEIVEVTDDVLVGNYTMTADKIYLLDGVVIVEAGDTLTIEAGTLIAGKALSTQTNLPAALVIAAGATILAEGERNNPIVLTSERAALEPGSNPEEVTSWWGGLYILGRAPLADGDIALLEFPGPANLDPRLRYGGADPEDSSGKLSFLSVRYVKGSGMNFLGVGRKDFFGREYSYLEVYRSTRNGFYFEGSSAFLDHLVAYGNDRSAFYCDNGTQVSGQSWLGVRPPRPGNTYEASMFFASGLDGLDGRPATRPTVYNMTLVDRSFPTPSIQGNTNGQLISFRLNAGGNLKQCLFVNGYTPTIVMDSLEDDYGSYSQFLTGELLLNFNAFVSEFRRPDLPGLLRISERPDDIVSEESLQIFALDNNQLQFGPSIQSSDVRNIRNFSPVLPPRSPYLDVAPGVAGSGFQPLNYAGAFGTVNWLSGWTEINRVADGLQTISGSLLYDAKRFDCEENKLRAPVPGTFVRIEVDGTEYHTTTSDSGRFFLRLPVGETTITAIPPSRSWEQCSDPISYVATPGLDSTFLIPMNEEGLCALPRVNIGALTLNGNGVSSYEITYGNLGTVAAEATEVFVELDSALVFLGTDLPGLTVVEEEPEGVRIVLRQVVPFARRTFRLFVEPVAGLPPGREICTTVTIDSETDCPAESSARLEVRGECLDDGETILFEVLNTGPLATLSPVPYIVVEDEVILNENTLELEAEAVREFRIENAGVRTYHFSTLETPDSAATEFVAATVSCAVDPVIPRAAYPATDLNSNVSTDCRELGAVLSRVEKTATPLGLTTDNFVPQEATITYQVTLANTLTDTVTVVNVLDTLSPLFDPTTVRLNVGGHAHNWEVENGVLRVTFPDIRLPADSLTYFNFSVRLRDSVAAGSLVYNDAVVSLDGRPGERSNRTFHTVGMLYDYLLPTEAVFKVSLPRILAFPSPATDRVHFVVPPALPRRGSYLVYDTAGRQLSRGTYEDSRFNVEVSGFTPGIYFCTTLKPGGRPTGWQRFLVQ